MDVRPSNLPPESDAGPACAEISDLYRRMRLIRRFEETLLDLLGSRAPEIHGPVHLYLGQEAVATGVCAALDLDDKIVSTHRGHGHCIAKGADPARMMAELFGRRTGYCRGRGGSMHIADFDAGVLGANGIVAAGLPIAAGAALAESLTSGNGVVACMFGDGAAGAGPLHETLNVAALWRLPLVLVCENNGWSAGSEPVEVLAADSVADLAEPYGVPSRTVDGNDVFAVRDATRWAAERARSGEGPALVEARTFRTGAHAIRDVVPPETRDPDTLAMWSGRDPLDHVAARARSAGIDEDALRDLDRSVDEQLTEALRFARSSPVPDPHEALEGVFAS